MLVDLAWLDQGTDDLVGISAAVGVGYAVPMQSYVIEAAARLDFVDFDKRDTRGTWTPSGDGNGSDGTYVELGANCYLQWPRK